ncbi:MAG: hypothetical protein JW811_01200 [Clostridiales bacterium]|nr:hypothetical protein [Clostridiales bacterium]
MKKLSFLKKEPLSHCGVAFLLACGLMLPMLMAMDLAAHVVSAVLLCVAILVLLTVFSSNKRYMLFLWILLAVFAVIQVFLPRMGIFGNWLEGFKAIGLYFGGNRVVLPLYGTQVAFLFAVFVAVLSFLVTKRGVGFLPMALMTVLVLFGLWTLGKGGYLWYVAPALVAILLQMSTEAHDRINLFHVLPMALVVVVLSLILLPAGKVTIGVLEKAASDLKQRITDYLFFTEPRNVFTIGSYGYYPMGSGQLGGAAEPSEYPVMTVKTGKKTLLRGVVKDEYTGRSFRDTSSAKRYLYINPRWKPQRLQAFLEEYPNETVRKASVLIDIKAVSVQMQNKAVSTVFTPLFLRSLNMAGDMVPYFNDASELFITRDLEIGDRYSVFAPVFEGGNAGLNKLVNAAAGTEDKYYETFFDLYTQLPNHLEQKLFDDVLNTVQNAETPYDQALTLMNYLKKYYRYTLTPKTPPENQDFVTYFLYVGKEGYCTYFASAMTVMCRIVGLPARYVEGFLAYPSSDGFAYVTGFDAHAWTEVYFEGFGWVPFDATPSQHEDDETPPTDEPEPTPTPEPDQNNNVPTPTPNPESNPEDQPTPQPSASPEPQDVPNPEDSQNNPFPWWILFVLAVAGAAGARVALRGPDRAASRKRTEKEKVFVYGAATARLLGYANYRPKAGETPLGFAKRVDAVHYFRKQVTPLWRILSLSNYSRLRPGAEQTRKAREIYRAIYQETNPLRKLRFLTALLVAKRFYTTLDTVLKHEEPKSIYAWNPRNLRKIKQIPEQKQTGRNAAKKTKPAARKSGHGGRGKKKR